ncbi:Predicted nucleic acid-binding protein, contains PIN domain [Halomicrobium zhouii]|uniref:Predicted nucleic acid-binding protein, contains PIN domain n=1 Tax=Halomicrobium zhouii TaxID=767519 RepID=A0A1I6M875_9EURY|nr:hypothetical protein [Halomicrobium zhouii]SFS11914.1 Predicted nucleic acid-binding protein, contains PIN domain [Halomicrobium zhouii]
MVVVDNNVLSSLAKISRLELLPGLFDDVGTVSSVFDELSQDAVAGYEFVGRIDDVKAYRGGWLEIRSLTEAELQLADDVADATLAFTDAECIAVAQNRDERLLTDDGHAGEMAAQRGVEVWDLKLLLEAALVRDLIASKSALSSVIDSLRENDGYRFSEQDRADLFEYL